MKIQKKYFVGKNKPGVWASVYAYKPHNDKIFQSKGEIFAAAILEGPADFDASVAGNLLLDILHESYFESKEKSALLALEEAVKSVKHRLINLVENDQATAINGINFDLISVVLKDNYLFGIRVGDGVLKVFRDGNLQDLAAGFRDPTGEDNYEVLSAIIEKGDTLFISTPQTLENFSEDEIFEGVSEYNEIGLKNKMLEDDSRVAMLMVGADLIKAPAGEAIVEMGRKRTSQGKNAETVSDIDDGNINIDETEAGMNLDMDADDRVQGEQVAFTQKKSKLDFQKIKSKTIVYAKKSADKAKNFGKKSKLKINEYRIKRRNRAAGVAPAALPVGAASAVTAAGAIAAGSIAAGSTAASSSAQVGATPSSTQGDTGAINNLPLGTGKNSLDRSTIQVYLAKTLAVVKKVTAKIYKFIKVDLLDIKDKGFYLRDARTGGINYRVVVAIVLVLFVIFFVGFRVRRTAINNARIEKENKQLVEELATDVNKISVNSVFTINTPDNVEEREAVLTQINTLEQRINNTSIDENYKTQLKQYTDQLKSLKSKLLREIVISNPTLMTDLGANFEGANPSDIAITDGKIYVSDKARNVIYQIPTDGSSAREAFKTDINAPRFITNDPEGGLVLVDGASTALALINVKTGQVTRFPGMSSGKFTNTQETAAYKVANNDIRFYMAMSSAPQVQQINKRGDAYSDGPKSRWSGAEYEGLTDIDLLDGKFIVIKSGEGLVRMFANSVITTHVTGLLGSDSTSGATKLAVDATYIYVADPSGKRILVFTKSRGNNVDYVDLIAQYKYTGTSNIFTNIIDIEVDGTNIYVLDGSKVYKLPKSDFVSFAY